jgi:hypothetical protein
LPISAPGVVQLIAKMPFQGLSIGRGLRASGRGMFRPFEIARAQPTSRADALL